MMRIDRIKQRENITGLISGLSIAAVIVLYLQWMPTVVNFIISN